MVLPWGGDPEYPRRTLVKGALQNMTSSVWFLERDVKGVFVLGYKERMAPSFATRVLGNTEARPASGFLHTRNPEDL